MLKQVFVLPEKKRAFLKMFISIGPAPDTVCLAYVLPSGSFADISQL